MKKYFHELTPKEYDGLVKKKLTYKQLGKDYPQPKWCDYPNATEGVMGCWSLISFRVSGKEFCDGCTCLNDKGE